MAIVTPRTPAGVMELLPRQQIAFQRMLDTIRRGYERFGFLPVETPVFELVDVLLTKSGGETEKQVYFVQSTGNRMAGRDPDMALRFDLTVPLARYVAEHERELSFPFRRYQIQRVYRGERAQKGRFREFYQCDVDVIGKDTLDVGYDAEIPAVINQVFTELNVGAFRINLSNRKILQGLLQHLGVAEAERRMAVLREIDRLDKIGRDAVLANLRGAEVGLEEEVAARIIAVIDLSGANLEVVERLKAMDVADETFRAGVSELETVVRGLSAFGVPEANTRVNLAIARGLDYYTGTVYETELVGRPEFGSVCSGGRYENLASLYTKSRLPGVGISIGATRLFSALLDANVVKAEGSTAQVFVSQLDPALLTDCFAIAAELRAAGLNTEVQIEAAKMAKQLKHADKQGIPFAVMLGSDEKAAGVVTVKNLRTGDQQQVPRADLAHRLRDMGAAAGA
ncbi:MAG TPA: histidine--tRNA ligase [Azospirillaceae bacterium]|nr:histidine--tRNA ligase [Azospirillaceae bacterium]